MSLGILERPERLLQFLCPDSYFFFQKVILFADQLLVLVKHPELLSLLLFFFLFEYVDFVCQGKGQQDYLQC